MSIFNIIQQDSKQCNIKISGEFNKFNIKKLYPNVKKVKQGRFDIITIDCHELEALDFAGAIVLADLSVYFSKLKIPFVIVGMNTEFKSIMLFARKSLRQKSETLTQKENPAVAIVNKYRKLITDLFASLALFSSFLGQSTVEFARVLRRPWKFRYKATAVHIEKSGAKALPIVALTSFLVGLVITYQGAEQLSKFGANIFIVEFSGISIFRELAPLIAAIVIAGRSASAYTAEIGTMKITQEIDAIKTMGFDPVLFLVLPRIVALIIAMPLIVFFADMVGIFGSMLVAKYQLGISYLEFTTRMRDVIEVKQILIGLFKAPFFGLLIALIGCFRGFQVSGSTESIGQYTTISVVNAIFWVIACNALISVVLTKVGI